MPLRHDDMHIDGLRPHAIGWVGLALVAVAALVLSGCGSGSDQGAAVVVHDGEVSSAALLSASETTAAVTSGRIRMTADIQGGDASAPSGTITAEGAFDTAAGRSTMEVDLGSAVAGLNGGELPSGLADAFGGTVTTVQDGTTIYLRWPGLQLLGVSTPWVSYDLEALASGTGMDLGALSGGIDAQSGRSFLESLRGVGATVEERGTETVDGVDTTVYGGLIDPARALDEVPEADRGAMEQALGSVGVGEIPFQAWVDADGIVRRLQLDLSVDDAGNGSAVSMSTTIELLDVGQPQTIEVPPADQVTPFSDSLLGGLAQRFGGLGEHHTA